LDQRSRAGAGPSHCRYDHVVNRRRGDARGESVGAGKHSERGISFSANACRQRRKKRWCGTTSCRNGSKRACRGYRIAIQLILCQTRKNGKGNGDPGGALRKAMSAGSALLQISTHADTCNASGLSGQHSSIIPPRFTVGDENRGQVPLLQESTDRSGQSSVRPNASSVVGGGSPSEVKWTMSSYACSRHARTTG
jgi:hypothetical protein